MVLLTFEVSRLPVDEAVPLVLDLPIEDKFIQSSHRLIEILWSLVVSLNRKAIGLKDQHGIVRIVGRIEGDDADVVLVALIADVCSHIFEVDAVPVVNCQYSLLFKDMILDKVLFLTCFDSLLTTEGMMFDEVLFPSWKDRDDTCKIGRRTQVHRNKGLIVFAEFGEGGVRASLPRIQIQELVDRATPLVQLELPKVKFFDLAFLSPFRPCSELVLVDGDAKRRVTLLPRRRTVNRIFAIRLIDQGEQGRVER